MNAREIAELREDIEDDKRRKARLEGSVATLVSELKSDYEVSPDKVDGLLSDIQSDIEDIQDEIRELERDITEELSRVGNRQSGELATGDTSRRRRRRIK